MLDKVDLSHLLIHKEETGSTNDDAKLLAEEGAPHMTAICANRQTHARGRHHRQWEACEGNVHFSLIIRPDDNWPNITDLVFVSALAVRNAIVQSILSDEEPNLKLKWPNDILLNDRKLAGILIETIGLGSRTVAPAIIIGVGVNVVHHPTNTTTYYPPTDLHIAGYKECERDTLVQTLHQSFANEITQWLTLGFEDVRQRYLAHAHHLNKTIRVGINADKSTYQEGIYQGIDQNGQLILRKPDGTTIKLITGDVLNHHCSDDTINLTPCS